MATILKEKSASRRRSHASVEPRHCTCSAQLWSYWVVKQFHLHSLFFFISPQQSRIVATNLHRRRVLQWEGPYFCFISSWLPVMQTIFSSWKKYGVFSLVLFWIWSCSIMTTLTLHVGEKKKGQGKQQWHHVPHQPSPACYGADICKLKGWWCLKALITPQLRAQCGVASKACFINAVQSEVRRCCAECIVLLI